MRRIIDAHATCDTRVRHGQMPTRSGAALGLRTGDEGGAFVPARDHCDLSVVPEPHRSRNVVRATSPTTTITTRSTTGDSRRPTVAPSWPPMIEPAAIRATTVQSTSATNTKITPATPFT